MLRLLFTLFLVIFSISSQAQDSYEERLSTLKIDIQSSDDAVAYIKASFSISKLKSCNISKQQEENYSKSKIFVNVKDDVLILKSLQLANQPCVVLLTVFDSLMTSENEIFERYPVGNIKTLTNKKEIQPLTKQTKKKRISPTKGDGAIFSLGFASVICASVAHVNPDAISGDSKLYFDDSVKLNAYFNDINLEEARKRQLTFYNLTTGEPAIKAQSLNSISRARAYVQQYLIKTDANRCEDIHSKANYLLNKYGLQL